MQFRKVGQKYQVLAYRGYDAEKKHAVVRRIGTIDRHSLAFTPSEEFEPTPDEKKEVQEFIEKNKKDNALSSARWALKSFPSTMASYMKLMEDNPDLLADSDVPAIIKALDQLKDKLKPFAKKSATTAKKVTTKPKKAAAKKAKAKR